MDIDNNLILEKEKKSWMEGESYYQEILAQDAIMVFSIGVLERRKVLETVSKGPRWDTIKISEDKIIKLGDREMLLTYKVTATRGDNEYEAFVSSIYKKQDDDWKICFHQQTPKQN